MPSSCQTDLRTPHAVAQPDGTIYLTYGAADYCVGGAVVAAREVIDALRAAA